MRRLDPNDKMLLSFTSSAKGQTDRKVCRHLRHVLENYFGGSCELKPSRGLECAGNCHESSNHQGSLKDVRRVKARTALPNYKVKRKQ